MCLFAALLGAVFQLYDFRFALGVDVNDEKIVELFLINRWHDSTAEHLDYVGNGVAVTDHEHALACVFENFVGDLRR